MGQPIYITDPVVATAYFVSVGTFAWVGDDAEAAWLIETHQGYPHDGQRAMPAAGFVHPDAPQPFVPYGTAPPPEGGTVPASITVAIATPSEGVFTATFAGTPDTAIATAHFVVRDNTDAVLSDVTYEHPIGATPADAAELLHAALVVNAALTLALAGDVLDIRGTDPVVVFAVTGEISVPAAARQASRHSRRRHAP